MGRWCPLPSRLEGLGERRKLQSPGRKRVLMHSELERTHVGDNKFSIFGGGEWGGGAAWLHISVSLQAPLHELVVGLLDGGYIAYVIPHIFSRGCIPTPRIYAHGET